MHEDEPGPRSENAGNGPGDARDEVGEPGDGPAGGGPADRPRVLERIAAGLRRQYWELPTTAAGLRRWLETTTNLVHVSVLLFVPLVITGVTAVSNAVAELSFLLFPPLASGAYTLFSDPEGRFAAPGRFVAGLTAGALCGWVGLLTVEADGGLGGVGGVPVDPASAGLAILLVGAVTWGLRLEEPAAFSTALLILVTDQSSPAAYVGSVAVGSTLVAAAFLAWRETLYERRAELLYGTLDADDRVLVPVRTDGDTAALLGAGLAAAHDGGRIVLLSAVAEAADAAAAGDALESRAAAVRDRYDVPCEVAVMQGDLADAVTRTVTGSDTDLVAMSVTGDDPATARVFAMDTDAVLLRAHTGTTAWNRVLVMVARPGDTAHAMLDFAGRIAGTGGSVDVCTCVPREAARRGAERTLADLAETADSPVETRVALADPVEYVGRRAAQYDLVLVGAPHAGDDPMRFLTGSAADRLGALECDLAVVKIGAVR